MKGFIELTLTGESNTDSLFERCDTVLVRPSCIVALYPYTRDQEGRFTRIALPAGRFVDVAETIDEIDELIKGVGE